MTVRGPRRRHSDRRNELWTVGDHQDFEEGIDRELEGVNKRLDTLTDKVELLGNRLAWVLGGLGVLVVVANLLAAFIIPRLIH